MGNHRTPSLRRLASIIPFLFLAGCAAFLPSTVPADLVVTFERGPCFGTCPVYALTVFADGTVAYNGVAFVLAEGDQRATLGSEEVERLHQAIVDADFFHLQDSYEVSATDLPSLLTTVAMEGQTKTVDHYGTGCGTDFDTAPAGLCEVEALLESIAVSNGWVAGN